MDFITNLPPSANHTVIWVVVDCLTNCGHFIVLPTNFFTAQLASVFIAKIYHLHRIPKTIVSDRDKLFVSKFQKQLFQTLGTQLAHISSYYPQTDGQIEVLNRCLKTYLCCFVSDEPQWWIRFLPLAEFWYNSSYHSAIGMSLCEPLYGILPPCIASHVLSVSKISLLEELLSQKKEILQLLKTNLIRARNRMTQQSNLKRTDKTFTEGQWVYLKLHPYRQFSIHNCSSQKLVKRFYGPFWIVRQIRKFAYELELPASSCFHPVFHVSLLKMCHGHPTSQVVPLPVDSANPVIPKPLCILGERQVSDCEGYQTKFLVHWLGQPKSEATWIPTTEFKATYPSFDLEDKIGLRGVGNDTKKNNTVKQNGPPEQADRHKLSTNRPLYLKDYI